jgi:hypothetical protein
MNDITWERTYSVEADAGSTLDGQGTSLGFGLRYENSPAGGIPGRNTRGKNMARLVYFTLVVAVAIGISASSAQTNGKAGSRVQSITGVVKAISASSLTLERNGSEITFGVDSSTRVLGKTGVRDLVYRPGVRGLTDFVKAGDRVTVRYRQSGSAMNAVEVRVDRK